MIRHDLFYKIIFIIGLILAQSIGDFFSHVNVQLICDFPFQSSVFIGWTFLFKSRCTLQLMTSDLKWFFRAIFNPNSSCTLHACLVLRWTVCVCDSCESEKTKLNWQIVCRIKKKKNSSMHVCVHTLNVLQVYTGCFWHPSKHRFV